MHWLEIVEIVKSLNLEVKLKVRNLDSSEVWTEFLLIPVDGYLESDCGPVPFRDVEWLLIKSKRTTYRGQLVAPMIEDLMIELVNALDKTGVMYSVEADGLKVTCAGA